MTGRRRTGDDARESRTSGVRAQSEVLSVALLLAITVAGTGLVVAFGSSALSDSQQASEIDSAEHAMTQFDSKASLVGLGASSAQTISLGTDGTTRVHEDRGWMRVSVVNRGDSPIQPVMNATLGAVVYENGDTRIAYQGGGVWKRTDGGATMVSPPEFHYRGTTLTLPLVAVNGDESETGSLDGRIRMTRDGPTNSTFPRSNNSTLRNPLEGGEVAVTVHSAYYDAWGQFFEQRTGGTVTYDHGRDRVTITLVVPGDTENVTNALAGTTPGEMIIKGSGGSAFTDSYDSSEEPYDEDDHNSDGTIVTAGSVTLTGGAELYGDLRTAGSVDLGGGVTVHGNVSYGGSLPKCRGGGNGCKSVEGWVENNGSAPKLDPIGDVVRERVDTLSDNNDNVDTPAIDESTDEWNDSASTLTLTSGSYYVANDTLTASQPLVFDTSKGDIDLVVDDDVVWNGVNVSVTDPEAGDVRIYTTASSFRVEDGTVGDGDTYRSSSLRVYAEPGLDFSLDNHATFVGLVYAPGTDSTSGSITVRTHSELYGGIVGGGITTLKSGGSIHFDEALRSVNPQADVGGDLPQLTYLHVSVSRVNVTDV